jgi:hypothetical protein
MVEKADFRRSDTLQRIVLLDSDQVALQNFDEMMTIDIGENNIASSHACTCNPRKLAHYPKDW